MENCLAVWEKSKPLTDTITHTVDMCGVKGGKWWRCGVPTPIIPAPLSLSPLPTSHSHQDSSDPLAESSPRGKLLSWPPHY